MSFDTIAGYNANAAMMHYNRAGITASQTTGYAFN